MSSTEADYIGTAINVMLSTRVVVIANEEKDQFISSIFTVPKSDGCRRFILNLKKLNKFLKVQHFKMEDIRTAVNLMSKGCYLAVLVQQDAYHMIPIHSSCRKFLRFRWMGVLYEYTCLPFGLSVAPWLYTKILKPVLATLRSQSFENVSYLDDLLIIGQTYAKCYANVECTISLFTRLGF